MKRGFKIFLLGLIAIFIIGIILFILIYYVIKPEPRMIIVHNNKKVENNIKKDRIIKDVKIKRNIYLEYHIYVDEYKPLFIREDTKKLVLSTKKEIDLKDNYNIIVPRVVNYVPDKTYIKLIKKINEIDSNIMEKVSDIKYFPNKYDEERFILYMNDKNIVYINLPKFKSINEYNKMVEKLEGKTGKLYLDSGNYFEYDKDKKIDNKDKRNENDTKMSISKKKNSD